MAKEENAATTAENAPVIITDANGKEVNAANLLAQLATAEVGQELTSDYFTLEPGETERVIFLEMAEMNKMGSENGETTGAVRLLGADGKFKICADKVIVSTCRAISSKGGKNVPIQITCTGKTKTGKGSYKNFEIKSLLM